MNIKNMFYVSEYSDNHRQQAGAELCQAQILLKLKLVLGLD